ncbi:hypothetical protein P389DRAFT_58132 [Cystobasidium minutum MCA 4210]|uniref:uncharacterized protein n=1 Tax=Cystobasidium minutum MCA 4210 TaxID=1397322 RepID=UPI0034CFF2AD|eukprot:jgi/Rhomi1/58132/CE58131_89
MHCYCGSVAVSPYRKVLVLILPLVDSSLTKNALSDFNPSLVRGAHCPFSGTPLRRCYECECIHVTRSSNAGVDNGTSSWRLVW